MPIQSPEGAQEEEQGLLGRNSDLTTSWLRDLDEGTLCPLRLCVLVCEMELIAPAAWMALRTERDDAEEVLGQRLQRGR